MNQEPPLAIAMLIGGVIAGIDFGLVLLALLRREEVARVTRYCAEFVGMESAATEAVEVHRSDRGVARGGAQLAA
jgi:hypothetical protein